ncbi:hypothetical protein ACVGIC_005525, partial [Escherichia coli]
PAGQKFQPATFLSACPQSGVQVQRVTERTESETAGRQAVQSALAPCPDTSFPETTGIRCAYRQPLCGMPGARTDPSDPSVLRSASDG